MKKTITILILALATFSFMQAQTWTASSIGLSLNPTTATVGIGGGASSNMKLSLYTTTSSTVDLFGVYNYTYNTNTTTPGAGVYGSYNKTYSANPNGYVFGVYSIIDPASVGEKYAGFFENGDVAIRNGKMGIGNIPPAYPLDVAGITRTNEIILPGGKINQNPTDNFTYNGQSIGHYSLNWVNDATVGGNVLLQSAWGGMKFFTNGTPRMVIQAGGNVGIGRTDPYYMLDVAGTIRAREVKINLNTGADFVFDKDYKLMNLNDLSKFVSENKHLPDIAPAEEMTNSDTDLGEMQVKLLQKIEELTLYVIQQNEEIQTLRTELNNLKNQ